MRLILIAFLSLVFTSCWAQDEGIILNWEKYVDSQDFTVLYDTTLTLLDSTVTFDTTVYEADTIVMPDTTIITPDTTIITRSVEYLYDSTFSSTTIYQTKYKSLDTVNTGYGSMGGYAYSVKVNEVDSSVFVQNYLNNIKKAYDQVARLQRLAMQQRANSLSYKKAFEDATDIPNAYVEIYKEYWPKLDSMTIRTTGDNPAFSIPQGKYAPNAAGVIKDANNKILMRIFPYSRNMWFVVVANDGNLQTGVSDFVYAEDGDVYINYSLNDSFGRLVIRNQKRLR